MPNKFLKITGLFFLFSALFFVLLFIWQRYEKNASYNVDILVENATIVTMNEDYEIIKNGYIAIKGGVIVEIGNKNHNFIPKERIDGKEKIAMPGLINTHTHVAMALFRGIDDNSNLTDWLSNLNNYEKKITQEDVYIGSLLSEIEMIKSGTTTFNDMYFFENSVRKSAEESKMRSFTDIPFSFNNNILEIPGEFINTDHPETINFSLAPNPLLSFSVPELKKISEESKKNNFIIHIHIAEDPEEKEKFKNKFGLTPLEVIENSNLAENRIVFVHSIDFTEDELKKISSYPNIGISFNPKSNFKLTGSTAPILKMMDYGITVGFGTDGAASANSLDLFDQINFAAFSSPRCDNAKTYCENNKVAPEKIISMATIDGAKILGIEDEVGSLEEGKKADIILIDFKNPGLIPSYDVYSSLVYNTDGSDVSDSIINGVVIMKNRKLVFQNEKKVIEKVKKISKRIVTAE